MGKVAFSYRWAALMVFAVVARMASADEVAVNAERVDAAEFLNGLAGSYLIETAGGEVPHDSNARTAEILIEGEEATFTIPYCGIPGICDPGYYFFPFADTEVTSELGNANQTVFRMKVKDGNATLEFTWEAIGDTIYFRNYQYQLPSGGYITLEHVLKRQ